ncbi:MAG: JAB domain-containing protein [Anaerobutyricum sp.]
MNPSKQDKIITQRLREAGGLMDIELLDHIIIGGKDGHYLA